MATRTLSSGDKLGDLLKNDKRFGSKKKDVKSTEKLKLPPLVGEKPPKNPFTLPKEQTWVGLWKEYKQRDLNRRRSERKKKVHQKHTFSSRVAYSAFPAIRQIGASEAEKSGSFKGGYATWNKKCRLRPVEREFTHDYIQKKREVFLMEYALQTKRDEVEKHKYQALEKDKKFARRVIRLQEDAILFDEFLKATDDAAVKRMKIAEKETRLKLEKVAEYRKLLSTAMAMKSEISKKDELLSEYFDCKTFLFHVYEMSLQKDFLVEERVESRQRKSPRTTSRRSQRRQRGTPDRKSLPPMSRKSVRVSKNVQTPKQDRAIIAKDSRQAISKIKYPKEWKDSEEDPTRDDGVPAHLPFDSPQQLLDIIRELEEKNLKLIFKYQQTEGDLLELKNYSKKSADRLSSETRQLASQADTANKSIEKYQERVERLSMMHTILSQESTERDSKQALAELKVVIEKVYKAIFTQSIVTMDSLVMLNCIEHRMDDLLEEVESHPISAVQDVQRALDKERRRQLREEKVAIQKMKQEERAKKAFERANAIGFKRTGRRLMSRSIPPKAKNRQSGKLALRTKSQESVDEFFSQD